MKNTKEMHAKGFYLFTGEASANSCFIESITEAKIFIRLAERYLAKYLKIHEYLLTPEAWMMQVRLRSRKKIVNAYIDKRERGGKCIPKDLEPWRIVSEQVRLMIAHYVKVTNKIERREGSKVKESYNRYYFESLKEATVIIEKMRKQKWKMIQRNKKYQKVKNHYRIPKKLAKGHVFLCSKKMNKDKMGGQKNTLNSLIFRKINIDLIGQYIENTFDSHNPSNTS